jgi:DNA (cytosine-5)-methyltransferase 1
MRTKNAVIDLFCGCGGLSMSAKAAGFDVSLSIDKDATLTSAYTLNFPQANMKIADIATLSGADLIRAAGGRPFGIIGGPPCQGFSAIGKRNKNDSRNDLIWHFFRLVAESKPQFFLMENVPGLLFRSNAPILGRALNLVHDQYEMADITVYDASEFGGATKRRRAVIIGYRSSSFDIPKIPNQIPAASVRDAIMDVPRASASDRAEFGWEWWKYRTRSAILSDFAKRARRIPGGDLGSALAKNMLKAGYVTGCMETLHTGPIVRRFSKVEQGSDDPISRYPRLSWNKPASTLRAGTGDDRGSYQAARPIHPIENRVITVREAARLQGFPDWFLFHSTKWHSFRMIGNSVSPSMGTPLLKALFRASIGANAIAAE